MSSVCLSVRPSVTLVGCDHIGWNSSEIISPLVSLWCSLSAYPNIRGLLQGGHPEMLAQSDPPLLIWASETFDRKLRPNGYRWRNGHNGEPIGNHHRSIALSNGAIADRLRPHIPPKLGSICPQDTRMAISLQRMILSTSCLVLGWGFGDGGSNGAIFDSNKFKMADADILDNFEWPYIRNGSRSTYIARIARSSLR